MSNKIIKVPAYKVEQPIGEFLVASVPASQLVNITYSDIRRMEGTDGKREIERYLGIQRPLKKSRVKEIRDYILNDKFATFPTSIILAIDEKCAEYDENSNMLSLYPFESINDEEESIPYNKIAKVLDGQHRIAGFYQENMDNQDFDLYKNFDLNVSIFIGIDIPEQAKIFATVNLAQTKVNKSLVYDLEDLARKPNPFKTCHQIAVALDSNKDSPFFERIKRLGVATPGREYEPLTQASFVEALVRFMSDNPKRDRNDILDGKKIVDLDLQKYPFRLFFKNGEEGTADLYHVIYNYFEAVRLKWPTAWAQKHRTGNLLTKSNAFKALMRYLGGSLYLEIVGSDIGRIPTKDEFIEKLRPIEISDEEFVSKTFLPGAAGEAKFYKLLMGEIEPTDLYE